ncbi:hypothetical protein CH29_gp18 [Achromobacter phage JWAlpha]|uniref:Uncharacterized protein n=1 Tax=Achromobacter phage JWAlpha TaxID=1416009 RepID=V9VFZ2_9CAUD|nr:hypothetical protein CH29_gp18 [Achromobacter phage JWAlpha]AHC93971.1 hypothetical protein JJJB_0018 [Achromobacter phage JWAlpha]
MYNPDTKRFIVLPEGEAKRFNPAINTVTIVPLVPDVTVHFQFYDRVSDLAATFGHSNTPLQPQHTFQFQFKNRQSFIMKQSNTVPPAGTPWENREWNL